ncbi:MAG: thioredoxin domain-containing protein [Cyanobacteria bacterium]|nr:thioredoxin domain-containing protein [Cyanobacteriota bacterium]
MRPMLELFCNKSLLCLTIGLILTLNIRPLPALAQTATSSGPKVDAQFEQQVLEVLKRNPEVILETLQRYQRNQQLKAQKAQQDILTALNTDRKRAIGQSPTDGKGKILVIEFSDFQCPFCAKARTELNGLVAKYPDRVTLVYKHFPLTQIHNEAMNAALASWAAQQQGKFWQYHNALFDQQKTLNTNSYTSIATTLGLDLAKFDRDRKSPQAKAAVEADQRLGEALGIDGTPAIILNGELLSGAVPLAELEKLLPSK